MSANSARKRTLTQIESDRAEIARRYLQGQTQHAIGQALGMTRQMVGYDLNIIRSRWRASASTDFGEATARELSKIDLLETTYWTAWEKSCSERQVTSTKRKAKGDSADTEAMLRKEQRDGNPAFLQGVQWCIERRCKMLGLDAPERVEHLGQVAISTITVELPPGMLDSAPLTIELPPPSTNGSAANGHDRT